LGAGVETTEDSVELSGARHPTHHASVDCSLVRIAARP